MKSLIHAKGIASITFNRNRTIRRKIPYIYSGFDKYNRNSRTSWCNTVLYGRSCSSSWARFSSSGAMSVPECATPWPSEEDAPRRGTPVWIIYSGCILKEEGGNFREAVLRWLRSFIASSPPYHLLHSHPHHHFFHPPVSLLLPSLASVLIRPRPFSRISSFRATRSARQCAATLSALICAQRERRKLMHVAHAGRESAGSLSSRTPALTRIHHRAAGSFDERRIVRRVVPPERESFFLVKDSRWSSNTHQNITNFP